MPRLVHWISLAAAITPLFGQSTIAVNLSGIITDSAGTPVSAAAIRLENLGLTATSGQDGRFTLTSGSAVRKAQPGAPIAAIKAGTLYLSLSESSPVTITAYGLEGRVLATLRRDLLAGSHALALPAGGSAGLPAGGTGLRFLKVEAGEYVTLVRAFSLDGALRGTPVGDREFPELSAMSKRSAGSAASAAAPLVDVLTATKSGFQKAYVSISNSDSADIRIKLLREGSARFSFFVTSMKALTDMAGPNGFGGDFRYGVTGAGAGLRGADKICATIAEKSMPGSSVKGWRAFLSVTADAHGQKVNAIDRVGPGPWYDRTGRLLAPTKADLRAVRPRNGDAVIQVDLPNENGIPNHRPDPTKPQDDNHHMVTGSDTAGNLKSATATCKDWTTSVHSQANGKPSCGFAWPRGGGGGGAMGGSHWMSTWDAPGCAPGIEIVNGGGPSQTANSAGWIGGGGGYGGFYCFALNP